MELVTSGFQKHRFVWTTHMRIKCGMGAKKLENLALFLLHFWPSLSLPKSFCFTDHICKVVFKPSPKFYWRQGIKSSSSLPMVPVPTWWCVARWSIYISMDFVNIYNSFLNLDSWSLRNRWLWPGHKCQRCICCSETLLSQGASGQLRILPWLVGYLKYIVRLLLEKDDNIGIL